MTIPASVDCVDHPQWLLYLTYTGENITEVMQAS